jgi:hypothetical protein
MPADSTIKLAGERSSNQAVISGSNAPPSTRPAPPGRAVRNAASKKRAAPRTEESKDQRPRNKLPRPEPRSIKPLQAQSTPRASVRGTKLQQIQTPRAAKAMRPAAKAPTPPRRAPTSGASNPANTSPGTGPRPIRSAPKASPPGSNPRNKPGSKPGRNSRAPLEKSAGDSEGTLGISATLARHARGFPNSPRFQGEPLSYAP